MKKAAAELDSQDSAPESSLNDQAYFDGGSGRQMRSRRRFQPRNDPNHFPGQNEYLYAARFVLLVLFAFMVGWGSEFSYNRFGAFTSMLTGNLILAARSMTEGRLREGSVGFYVAVILANLAGSYFYAVVRVFTPWAGTLMMPLVVVMLAVGDGLWDAGVKSRWLACLMAPIFGAVNVMITYGPVGVTPTFATASLQKLAQFPPKRFAQRYKRKEYAEVLLLAGSVAGLFCGVLFSGMLLYSLPFENHYWSELVMAGMFFVLLPLHDFLFYYVLVEYLPPDALPEEHLKHKVFRWCGEWSDDEDDKDVESPSSEE